jgi:5-methylcytosine-specific restriction endonuclease McrA
MTRTIGTQAWKQLRARVLAEEPTCRLQLPGCTTISTTADHIIPRSQRPDLELVRANVQGACKSCNYKRGNADVQALKPAPARAAPANSGAARL